MTTKKTYQKTLCLFYILTLFLWSTFSVAFPAPEITELVGGSNNYYVNRSSAITSTTRHLSTQEYLSARDSGTPETLSASRTRSARPLSRSVRQAAAYLFSGNTLSNPHAYSGLFSVHEIPAHSSCGIIITNYIHLQDGQKS